MAVEFGRGQPQAAILFRQVAAGMIGQKHDASLAVALDNVEGRENCGSGHWRKMVVRWPSGRMLSSFHEDDLCAMPLFSQGFPENLAPGDGRAPGAFLNRLELVKTAR